MAAIETLLDNPLLRITNGLTALILPLKSPEWGN